MLQRLKTTWTSRFHQYTNYGLKGNSRATHAREMRKHGKSTYLTTATGSMNRKRLLGHLLLKVTRATTW